MATSDRSSSLKTEKIDNRRGYLNSQKEVRPTTKVIGAKESKKVASGVRKHFHKTVINTLFLTNLSVPHVQASTNVPGNSTLDGTDNGIGRKAYPQRVLAHELAGAILSVVDTHKAGVHGHHTALSGSNEKQTGEREELSGKPNERQVGGSSVERMIERGCIDSNSIALKKRVGNLAS